MTSKSKRRVTVETGSSGPDDSEKRKPSVFERLGPGAGQRKYQDFESEREKKCRPFLLTGECPYGATCKYKHVTLSRKSRNRDDDASPENMRLKLKGSQSDRSSGDKRRDSDSETHEAHSRSASRSRRDKDSEAGEGGPSRSSSHSRRDKDTKIRSQVVVKKSENQDSDESGDNDSESNWFNSLDYKKELELEQKRQQLQRELSQLAEEEVEGGPGISLHKQVSQLVVPSMDTHSPDIGARGSKAFTSPHDKRSTSPSGRVKKEKKKHRTKSPPDISVKDKKASTPPPEKSKEHKKKHDSYDEGHKKHKKNKKDKKRSMSPPLDTGRKKDKEESESASRAGEDHSSSRRHSHSRGKRSRSSSSDSSVSPARSKDGKEKGKGKGKKKKSRGSKADPGSGSDNTPSKSKKWLSPLKKTLKLKKAKASGSTGDLKDDDGYSKKDRSPQGSRRGSVTGDDSRKDYEPKSRGRSVERRDRKHKGRKSQSPMAGSGKRDDRHRDSSLDRKGKRSKSPDRGGSGKRRDGSYERRKWDHSSEREGRKGEENRGKRSSPSHKPELYSPSQLDRESPALDSSSAGRRRPRDREGDRDEDREGASRERSRRGDEKADARGAHSPERSGHGRRGDGDQFERYGQDRGRYDSDRTHGDFRGGQESSADREQRGRHSDQFERGSLQRDRSRNDGGGGGGRDGNFDRSDNARGAAREGRDGPRESEGRVSDRERDRSRDAARDRGDSRDGRDREGRAGMNERRPYRDDSREGARGNDRRSREAPPEPRPPLERGDRPDRGEPRLERGDSRSEREPGRLDRDGRLDRPEPRSDREGRGDRGEARLDREGRLDRGEPRLDREGRLDRGEPRLDREGRLDRGEPRLDREGRLDREPRLDRGEPRLDRGEPRLDREGRLVREPRLDRGEPRLDRGEPRLDREGRLDRGEPRLDRDGRLDRGEGRLDRGDGREDRNDPRAERDARLDRSLERGDRSDLRLDRGDARMDRRSDPLLPPVDPLGFRPGRGLGAVPSDGRVPMRGMSGAGLLENIEFLQGQLRDPLLRPGERLERGLEPGVIPPLPRDRFEPEFRRDGPGFRDELMAAGVLRGERRGEDLFLGPDPQQRGRRFEDDRMPVRLLVDERQGRLMPPNVPPFDFERGPLLPDLRAVQDLAQRRLPLPLPLPSEVLPPRRGGGGGPNFERDIPRAGREPRDDRGRRDPRELEFGPDLGRDRRGGEHPREGEFIPDLMRDFPRDPHWDRDGGKNPRDLPPDVGRDPHPRDPAGRRGRNEDAELDRGRDRGRSDFPRRDRDRREEDKAKAVEAGEKRGDESERGEKEKAEGSDARSTRSAEDVREGRGKKEGGDAGRLKGGKERDSQSDGKRSPARSRPGTERSPRLSSERRAPKRARSLSPNKRRQTPPSSSADPTKKGASPLVKSDRRARSRSPSGSRRRADDDTLRSPTKKDLTRSPAAKRLREESRSPGRKGSRHASPTGSLGSHGSLERRRWPPGVLRDGDNRLLGPGRGDRDSPARRDRDKERDSPARRERDREGVSKLEKFGDGSRDREGDKTEGSRKRGRSPLRVPSRGSDTGERGRKRWRGDESWAETAGAGEEERDGSRQKLDLARPGEHGPESGSKLPSNMSPGASADLAKFGRRSHEDLALLDPRSGRNDDRHEGRAGLGPDGDHSLTGQSGEEDPDYEKISSDESDFEADDGDKQNIVSVLDIDWSSLTKQDAPKPSTGSLLKRFHPATIFRQIGISKAFAGPALFDKVKAICQEGVQAEEIKDKKAEKENTPVAEPAESAGEKAEGDAPPKPIAEAVKEDISLLSEVPVMHLSAVRHKRERGNLLRNLGPFRRALCARRDLEIRRQLCKVDKVYEQPAVFPAHVMDPDLCKLSIQLFRQGRDFADRKDSDCEEKLELSI